MRGGAMSEGHGEVLRDRCNFSSQLEVLSERAHFQFQIERGVHERRCFDRIFAKVAIDDVWHCKVAPFETKAEDE